MSIDHWQEWLYRRLKAYEQRGHRGLHPTLKYMEQWDARLNHPHRRYPVLHIAGTNGKGSTSAYLASILQSAGYRVGLHTSPHFWYFTERMRVNGKEPPEYWVETFLSQWHADIERLDLSFFEATVGMSFAYFAEAQVDIAIIEVGLGGLWDATNVVNPLLSVITPIGWDHVEILGPTIEDIAKQKGGIIKPSRPVIVSPQEHPEVLPVLKSIAQEKNAPFIEASLRLEPAEWIKAEDTYLRVFEGEGRRYVTDLTGDYQAVNLATVIVVVETLRQMGWQIPEEAVESGIAQAGRKAPLYGRGQWLVTQDTTLLLDVAHNPPAFSALRRLLDSAPTPLEGLIIGFSQEKDIRRCLEILGPWPGPTFFTAANTPRALSPQSLQEIAASLGYQGEALPSCKEAIQRARSACKSFLITGSVYLVAEALSAIHALSH
ncbi:MAG: folylpolyglutamate synthase/dihydrofolate synthase family protein [Bacteroidia bacterium]|nr:bifunctional folylpolyglutamate synthase/dihydrofolate synthase [Bacteroidia bacterium]MDW8015466.1 folylpolyglutamate synthase/dihydrofolate synthase family protein [Bacteroidia bacterium]